MANSPDTESAVILGFLNDVIECIERTPQINAAGVRDKLAGLDKRVREDTSASTGTRPPIYNEVMDYANKVKEAIEHHREQNFDNREGILTNLYKVRERYAYNNPSFDNS
jgi:hypothetical protein